ncbi:MAG: AAA family ATPase, partial [Rubrivivax sp.]
MPFIRTKICPPQARPGALMIERPALERALGAALTTRRLVVLCAPAGFGKTAALARQGPQLPPGSAFIWIECDEGDTPAGLLECLIAALEPHDPPWRSAPEALLRAAVEARRPTQWRAVQAELIHTLAACDVRHGVVVLDDLHRVTHPALAPALDALVERLPPQWTLALASRDRPALASLARLRAAGELAELGTDALRFDADETMRLVRAAGFDAALAGRVHARTQGWPVGVRLALQAAPLATTAPIATIATREHTADDDGGDGAAAPPIDRARFDFLVDEVIDRLPPPLRQFLLRCSILPELTAPRAAALSGDPLAAQHLDTIERTGLFAARLDDVPEPTLRLHDLFRAALQARLQRTDPVGHAKALARAAATEPDPLRRVDWLLRAQDWHGAEAALQAGAGALVAAGAGNAVQRLFDRIPPAQRSGSAGLEWLLARARWDWDGAAAALERVAVDAGAHDKPQQRLDALSRRAQVLSGANRHVEARAQLAALLADPALAGDALARTLASAAWMELGHGDERRLPALLARLLDVLERGQPLATWSECAPLPPYAGVPGLRPLLWRFVDGAERRLPDAPTPLRGSCQVLRGWLHLL